MYSSKSIVIKLVHRVLPLLQLNCSGTYRKLKQYSSLSKMNQDPENNIVWIDCEMTGLDVKKDSILEIACIVTDKQLNIISEGPCLAIHQTDEVLSKMDEWCMQHHTKSGLVTKCRNSEVCVGKAESILLEFLQKDVPRGKCPLAGNSIYMDRLFLMEYMPRLNNYLHYRSIDVSSIKELCKRWSPIAHKNAPKKKLMHRSLEDIKESIEELTYYKAHFFK